MATMSMSVSGGKADLYAVWSTTDLKRTVDLADYPDKEINELGARGIGEISLAGFAAAVTSAVHHATGEDRLAIELRRLRNPIDSGDPLFGDDYEAEACSGWG